MKNAARDQSMKSAPLDGRWVVLAWRLMGSDKFGESIEKYNPHYGYINRDGNQAGTWGNDESILHPRPSKWREISLDERSQMISGLIKPGSMLGSEICL